MISLDIIIYLFPILLDLFRDYPKLDIRSIRKEGRLETYLFVKIFPVSIIILAYWVLKRNLGEDSNSIILFIIQSIYSLATYSLSQKLVKRIYRKYEYKKYSELWLTNNFLAEVIYSCSICILVFVLSLI